MAQDSSYIDIDSNLSRKRTNFLSINSSRESFAHFSVLFIPYMERMEIQNNNPFQAEQVEENKQIAIFQGTKLSYATLKNRKPFYSPNLSTPINIFSSYVEGASINNTNICISHGINSDIIFCTNNQPVQSNSWNREALPISIFGTNKFLESLHHYLEQQTLFRIKVSKRDLRINLLLSQNLVK